MKLGDQRINEPIDYADLTGTPDAPEGTSIKSTGETGGTKFLREDGDGTCSWQDAGGGHTQNTDTGTTGNTFTIDSDSTTGKIIVDVALGAADLSLTLTNEALTSTSKTATFPNKTGTIAMTSDIPVKASGSELTTGTDDAKFATALALANSDYILGSRGDEVYVSRQHTDGGDGGGVDLESKTTPVADDAFAFWDSEASNTIKVFKFSDLIAHLDTLYAKLGE